MGQSGVNNSSDPVAAALQLLVLGGFLGWWAYLGGIVLGAVVLMQRVARARRAAIFAILMQFAPALALLAVILAALLQLALNLSLPAVLTSGVVSLALLAGPAASLWLVFTLIAGRRAVPREDGPGLV